MFFTDRAKHLQLERQRSQPKIALSYIWHKHMCHGAQRDKGTQILKVRKVYVREIHSTPRPKENERNIWMNQGWHFSQAFKRTGAKCQGEQELSCSGTQDSKALAQISTSVLYLPSLKTQQFFPASSIGFLCINFFISPFQGFLSCNSSFSFCFLLPFLLESSNPLHLQYVNYQKQ